MNNPTFSILRTGSLLDPFSSYFHSAAVAGTMPVDIEDDESEWRIKADLPGIAKKDVKVKLENDILSIKASYDSQRQNECESGSDDNGKFRYLIAERNTGPIERKFRLAAGIDNGAINASLKNGVLTVTVAKPDNDRKGKEIDIC